MNRSELIRYAAWGIWLASAFAVAAVALRLVEKGIAT